jgi:ATP-binding cassette subfamily F protein 3
VAKGAAGSGAATPKPPAAAAGAPAGGRRDDRNDRKAASQARSELANRTRPLRQEVQQIDGRLEKLGRERTDIEAQLAGGSLPGPEIAEAGRRLNHIAAEVAMLEERWLELQSRSGPRHRQAIPARRSTTGGAATAASGKTI